MVASKSSDDISMQLKVTKGLDKIISRTKSINSALKIHEEDSERKTFVGKGIFIWKVVLQKSQYLKSFRDTEYVYSINGKRLSGDMIDCSENL